MTKYLLILNILFVLSIITSCAPIKEKNNPSCDIHDWGIISGSTFKRSYKDKIQFSGVSRYHKGIEIVKTTQNIPIEYNISFGVSHSFHNIDLNEKILKQVTHPLFTKPNGDASRVDVKLIKPSHVGSSWKLNRKWEQVPGEWKFEFFYKGKLLCSKSFTTFTQ